MVGCRVMGVNSMFIFAFSDFRVYLSNNLFVKSLLAYGEHGSKSEPSCVEL